MNHSVVILDWIFFLILILDSIFLFFFDFSDFRMAVIRILLIRSIPKSKTIKKIKKIESKIKIKKNPIQNDNRMVHSFLGRV